MRWGAIQIILMPLGLVLSVLLMSTGMRHSSVQETSPIMGSAEAVQRWADHESEVRQCLRWSIEAETIHEDGIPTDPGKEHWFARLSCSHSSVYMQWVILLVGPWLFMNLVMLLLIRMVPRDDGGDASGGGRQPAWPPPGHGD
jgi:hypothetical protein